MRRASLFSGTDLCGMRFVFLLCFSTLLCTGVRAQSPISGFATPKGEITIALGYSSEKYGTYLLPEDLKEARAVETRDFGGRGCRFRWYLHWAKRAMEYWGGV